MNNRLSTHHDGETAVDDRDTPDAVIGRIHTAIVELIRGTPTFFMTARQLLSHEMQSTANRSNPDTLFINTLDAQGEVVSTMTSTQGFIGTLLKGPSFLDGSDRVVALRPDSRRGFDQDPDLDLNSLKDLYARASSRLEQAMRKVWDESLTIQSPLEGEPHTSTRRGVLTWLYVQTLTREIDIALERGVFAPADADICRRLLSSSGIAGFSSVNVKAPSGVSAPVVGAVACADDETGATYLFQLTRGWSQYPSKDAIATAVVEQTASDHEMHDVFMGGLPVQVAASIADADAAATEVFLQPLEDEYHHEFLRCLIKKQRSDIAYELAEAQSEELEPLWARMDHAIELGDLEEMILSRMAKLFGETRSDTDPEWLKSADNSSRRQFYELEEHYDLAEAHMDDQLAEVGHQYDYARRRLMQGIYNALFYSVEPSEVLIELNETFDLSWEGAKYGREETISHHTTLLELAVSGMPSVKADNVRVTLPEGYEHSAFDGEFVIELLRAVDIPVRYGAALEALYQAPTMENAVGEFYGSGLARELMAARLQGHLSADLYEPIASLLRNGTVPEDVVFGKLKLRNGAEYFEDLLTIELKAQGKWILYAPGAPGMSVFELSNFKQVSDTVFRWAHTWYGADYIRSQTTVRTVDEPGYMRRRPQPQRTEWVSDRLVVEAFEERDMAPILLAVARQKIARQVERGGYVSASKRYAQRPSIIQEIITLDFRIDGLNKVYRRLSSVRPYEERAHEECMKLVNQHIQAQGSEELIDPDTVFFDLSDGAVRMDNPGADGNGHFRTLTDLFMEGFSREDYELNPDAIMYSLIGQDLSGLSVEFVDQMIQNSDFGADYLKKVKGEQDMSLVANLARRSIFVQLLKYQIKRAALAENLSARISDRQLAWISQMTKGRWPQTAYPKAAAPEGSRIVPLCLVSGTPVAGCYLLYENKIHDDFSMVYTPNAPDGVEFRSPESMILAVRRSEMQAYVLRRTESGKQGSVGRLLHQIANHDSLDQVDRHNRTDKFLRPPIWEAYHVTGLYTYTDSQPGWYYTYDYYLDQIYRDIDRLTESVKERFALDAYYFIRKYGGYVVSVLPKPLLPIKIAWHLVHMTVDLVRAKRAYDAGNTGKALGLLKDAYNQAKSARKTNQKYRDWRKNRIDKQGIKRVERRYNNVTDILNPVRL
jgi:hypothetical protein